MIALRVMAVSLALLGSAAGQVPQTKTPNTTMEMLIGAWEVTKVQDADKQKLTVGSTVVFGTRTRYRSCRFSRASRSPLKVPGVLTKT